MSAMEEGNSPRRMYSSERLITIPQRGFHNEGVNSRLQVPEGLQASHGLSSRRSQVTEDLPDSSPMPSYPPLEEPTNQIRLLRLTLDDYESENTPLPCSLKVLTLQEASQEGYNVLSYCWGDMSETRQISINGRIHDVSANLEAALQRIRDSPYSDALIWADAICINQEDLEEKRLQVNMMASTFSNATVCLIWLGDISMLPDDETTTDRGNTIYAPLAYKAFNLIESLARNDHYTRPGSNEESSIGPLMKLNWWHRIWTVQEVVLPSQCVIMCGELETSWAYLREAAKNFRRHHYEMCCNRAVGSLKEFDSKIAGIESTRNEAMTSKGVNLVRILQKFQDRGAWDPRDKVYGLLALGARQRPGVPGSVALSADYSMETPDVFIQTARLLLQQTRSLELLLRAKEYDRDPALPSWVPDWTAKNDRHRTRELERWTTWDCHNACGGKRVELGVRDADPTPEILHLAGVKVDEITIVGDACEDPQAFSATPEGSIVMAFPEGQWRLLLEKEGKMNTAYRLRSSSYAEAFMRVLARDSVEDSHGSDGGSSERRIRPEDVAACLQEVRSHTRQHKTYFRSKMLNRRFFITKTGLIGTGPVDTAVGDLAFVLFGGNLPFILRRTTCSHLDNPGFDMSRLYSFVGDAYIYGVMDGEYADEAKKEWVFLL